MGQRLIIKPDQVEFSNDFRHKEIKWLKWDLLNELDRDSYLIYSDFNFKDRSKKRLVYYVRWHSWRGKIYTGYLVDQDETNLLELDYEKNPQKLFYPNDKLAYGYYWSWWINNVFQYQGSYYYLDESNKFDRNSGLRNIIKINSDGSLETIARLKIYMSLKEILSKQEFAFYKAYLLVVNNIMGKELPNSGTLHSQTRALLAGEYGATQAILRPWALISQNKTNYIAAKRFLKNWAYQDSWNLREYQVLQNHLRFTRKRLAKFYFNYYDLDDKTAAIMADNAVWAVINSYLVIPGYFNNNYSKETLTTYFNKNLLMYAAHLNNYQAVKKLIKLGYDVNARTIQAESWLATPSIYNRTALMYAAENASPEIIRELIKAGADLTAVDSIGRGITYYISQNPRFNDKEKQIDLLDLINKYQKNNKMFKASFEIDKATTRIEKTIVNNKSLAIYDREMAKTYHKLFALSEEKEIIKKDQQTWLKLRSKKVAKINNKTSFIIKLIQLTRARNRYLFQQISALEN
ncbi:ankyrin repeat domain-containing protein [Halanaerobium salsuginis]|uniref:Ankyrin repeat-containing protein n=1 Tax=Halanaerobium salsuginis TaxID=29563 RepID=A0A1I4MB18_9FIRM|nr:ankyrin repeat domain-containing protein [Halanaerobium salsuginis]SFM00418.1 Ankyrin repeat-containing protein [Halanaerobium salsuginis]